VCVNQYDREVNILGEAAADVCYSVYELHVLCCSDDKVIYLNGCINFGMEENICIR